MQKCLGEHSTWQWKLMHTPRWSNSLTLPSPTHPPTHPHICVALLQGSAVPVPIVDDLLPDLLAFPAGTDLHDHPMVLDGTLVLQVGLPGAQALSVSSVHGCADWD